MTSLATRYTNLQASVTGVIKATPGNLISITTCNRNAALRYLLLFDRATVVVGGEVPVESYLIPIGGTRQFGLSDFGPAGAQFLTGITFAISTTPTTFTAATATDHETIAKYS